MQSRIPSVVSTFSGCGGSSCGYVMAGFKVRLAVEWDKDAVATYRLNFPETPINEGDISELSVERCLLLAGLVPGEVDILDGSPPCQGFSTAGSRNFGDDRNQLFREFVRLLKGLLPRAFVLENVSGMVKGKMRLVFRDMLQELKAAGYQVKARVLNAQYFDVPQSRQRLIVIGARNDLGVTPTHPPPSKAGLISVRRAIGLNGGGIKNKQFANKYRSLDLPCVTIERTRPPILLHEGIERELTLAECAKIGTFPDDWRWGNKACQQIGNSIPPNFMRAIAEHIRDTILTEKVKRISATS